MFYKKSGFPEENELVICTVKKTLPNAVFVTLDGYKDKEGIIYLFEIAPGRIRNIREYVKEGKRIVCKVLRVDQKKGHIDLSLRRVPPSLARAKTIEYKQEEKAEKILERVAHEMKITLADLYEKAGNKIIENYGSLSAYFQKIVANEPLIEIPGDINKILIAVVKEKIKPPEVSISEILQIESYAEDGVVKIKNLLNEVEEKAKNNNNKINILYVGAPNYRLTVFARDYKSAEKIISSLLEVLSQKFEDGKIEILKAK